MSGGEIERAYEAMRNAPNYTAYKDRKRHYERLLAQARRETCRESKTKAS